MQNTSAYQGNSSNSRIALCNYSFCSSLCTFPLLPPGLHLQTDPAHLCKVTPCVIIKFQYVLIFSTFSNPVWYGIESQKWFALLCNCILSSPRLKVSSTHCLWCSFTLCILSGFIDRCLPSPRRTKFLTLKADTQFPSWHQWHHRDICKVPTAWNFFSFLPVPTHSAACRMFC